MRKRTLITTKITIGYIITIAILGIAIFFCCESYSANSFKTSNKKLALSCAQSVASALQNVPVKDFVIKGKNEKYNELLSFINSVCRSFNLKYLYVYIPDFKNNKLTSVFYVDGSDKAKNVEGRELGSIFDWEFSKQEIDSFNGIKTDDMYNVENAMGHTITSYAPVYNKKGEAIALVGADLDYNEVMDAFLSDILKIIIMLTIALVIIYAALISYLKFVFIKPVIKIATRMSNFADETEAKFDPIEYNSDDELGLMAHAFNKMAKDIGEYIKKISDTQMETIFSLAKLAQSRDDDTGKHIARVQNYCEILAKKLKEDSLYSDVIDDEFIQNIVNASTLHDIGKVGISDLVLLKKGKLTDEEFNQIKEHTTIGYETLKEAHSKFKSNKFIEMGMVIAHYHHERWDGKGYPTGLKGEEIPLAARIMSIADVYDALGTKRVYKPAFPQEKCVSIIKEGSGTQFDPVIVDAFLEVADEFYQTRCKLED